MSVSWDGRLLCRVMSIYFLRKQKQKNYPPSPSPSPHSLDYTHNSNLKFYRLWWIYIFFGALREAFRFIVGLCFLMDVPSAFVVSYWDISENTRPPPPFLCGVVLSHLSVPTWCPAGLTCFLPVTVAVRERRHGATHCLNTDDQSRWKQETPPRLKTTPWRDVFFFRNEPRFFFFFSLNLINPVWIFTLRLVFLLFSF